MTMYINTCNWSIQARAGICMALIPQELKEKLIENLQVIKFELYKYRNIRRDDLKELYKHEIVAGVQLGRYKERVEKALNVIK